jgi:molecular chaperone DnaK
MEEFGIDFGTTNSGAVGFQRGELRCFGHDAKQPLPSVIAINRLTGQVRAIGREAYDRREELREHCEIISSVKSHLGDDSRHWIIGPETWTPERVTTEILHELRRKVTSALTKGQQFDTAVCSIPVGFAPRKRQALRRAAAAAGIQVKSFISEPTAAVCRHFSAMRRSPTVAVFDWGGGTLDISVVRIKEREVQELATFGVPLGGEDLDQKIAVYVHGRIAADRGLDIPFEAVDPRSRDRLKERVEASKRRLSSEDTVELGLNLYHGLHNVTCTLTAATLRDLLQNEYQQAFEALATTVQQRARTSFSESRVLMVGGSSKLRGLQEYFYEQGVQNIEAPPDADWNIAQGAAMMAATPGKHVIARDLGLAVSDGSYFPLLREGDVVDHQPMRCHFGLVEDTREARFVFVQQRRFNGVEGDHLGYDTVGYLNVPAYGFSDEPISLSTRVTEDLIVEIEGSSTRRNHSSKASWSYNKLNFRYRMPGDK